MARVMGMGIPGDTIYSLLWSSYVARGRWRLWIVVAQVHCRDTVSLQSGRGGSVTTVVLTCDGTDPVSATTVD